MSRSESLLHWFKLNQPREPKPPLTPEEARRESKRNFVSYNQRIAEARERLIASQIPRVEEQIRDCMARGRFDVIADVSLLVNAEVAEHFRSRGFDARVMSIGTLDINWREGSEAS